METQKVLRPAAVRGSSVINAADVRFATWIALLAWVFAVYDFILFGTLLPEIGRAFGWSGPEQAALATWVAVGTAVVALVVGPLVDRLGRRAGIVLTVAGAGFCSLLTALGGALGQGVLVLIRSLAGTGYAEQAVNATYLNEIYAAADDPDLDRRKGFIYSLVQGGWPIGALVAAGLTALLLPTVGWQGCFIFAAVPSFVIAWLARGLKETPQFEQLRAATAGRTAADLPAAAADGAGRTAVTASASAATGFGAVFRGETLRTTLVLAGAFMLNWFAIQVFSVLGSTVITSVHRVTFQNSLLVLLLSNLLAYAGYLVHGYLGDRIGRRNTIAGGWMLGGLAFAGMLYGPHDFGVVVALYSLGLFFLIGPYAALLFFVGESFPTAIRGTGGALVNASGPVGAIIAGLGATAVLKQSGSWQTAALYFGALPCFASGLLILAARPVDPRRPR